MKIFPAIDIKDGQAVRLKQGDYDQMTVYNSDPLEVAREFLTLGATHLHVVDLDGARERRPVNTDLIKRICALPNLFVQVGGGIRDEAAIAEYLAAGVSRIILGSAAVQNLDWTAEIATKYGDKIAVGVDAKDEKVAINGWLETTDVNSVEFCTQLRDLGVRTVIYTDISRDGMEMGTNLDVYSRLSAIENLDIIASGGVTFLDEITALRDMKIYGTILGKAIYTSKISLAEALKQQEQHHE